MSRGEERYGPLGQDKVPRLTGLSSPHSVTSVFLCQALVCVLENTNFPRLSLTFSLLRESGL